MGKNIFFIVIVLLVQSITGIQPVSAQEPEAKAVILQMIDSAYALKGFKSVIRKTERIKELGAKATKVLDQRLVDRAND